MSWPSSAKLQPTAPMLLRPIPKGRAWGGDTFVRWGKFTARDAARQPVGEAWELCDLPDAIPEGCSTIEAGFLAGHTLREAMHAEERRIMGRAQLSALGRFPLLVKFLDAAEHLSVQVHPDPAYAASNPGAHLKTESWFVLDAAPGARIWRGIRPGISRETFERALRGGDDIVPMLVEVAVKAGDFVDLPSGLCHALGAGITVAEIQTPSDTTFRVFDWNRGDPDRPLHVDQAMACMSFGAAQGLDRVPVVHALDAPAIRTRQFRTTELSRTGHYRIERLEALEAASLTVVTHGRPSCWMVLEGSVRFDEPEALVAGRWQTLLVPAASEGCVAHLEAGTVLLRASLPDPMDSWIA